MTGHEPTTALATHERPELAQSAPAVIFAGAIQQILRAAGDGTTEASKVRELYAIAKEMKADYAKDMFYAALARVQRDLPRISKDGHAIVKDKQTGALVRDTAYARYEDIDKAVRPLLAAEGFAVSFDSKTGQGGTVFDCKLSHSEGHSETKYLSLPIDASGGKNAIQGMGSSVSYAKRYLLGMHLNIITVDEDDDGNGGSDPVTKIQAEEIYQAAVAAKADIAKFLKYMGAGTFEEIKVRDVPKAMSALEAKRAKP